MQGLEIREALAVLAWLGRDRAVCFSEMLLVPEDTSSDRLGVRSRGF